MTGRRATWVIAVALVVAALGAALAVLWGAWDDADTGAGFTEFQRAISPDGDWVVVLEESDSFGFGPRRIRVLAGEVGADPAVRGFVGVGGDGAYLVGCGLRWGPSSVTVRCVDDADGDHEMTVDR